MSGQRYGGKPFRAHGTARRFFGRSTVWIVIGIAWAGCCGVSSNDSSSGCSPAAPQCYTDSGCAINQVCEDGRCIAATMCASDRDCPDGQVCFPSGDGHKAACRPPNDAGRPCLQDTDCPDGAYCSCRQGAIPATERPATASAPRPSPPRPPPHPWGAPRPSPAPLAWRASTDKAVPTPEPAWQSTRSPTPPTGR